MAKKSKKPVYVATARIASKDGDQVWEKGEEVTALTDAALKILLSRGRIRLAEPASSDSMEVSSDGTDDNGDAAEHCRD